MPGPRFLKPWVVAVACGCALGACSTASKPPVVDGANRRPVNNRETTAELSSRTSPPRGQLKADTPPAPPLAGGAVRAQSPASRVVSVQFPINSTRPQVSDEQKALLAAVLKTAGRIVIHVQTRTAQGSADERLALNRALGVKQFLVAQGAAPQTISVNYIARESRESRDWSRQADIEIITTGATP